MDIVCGAAGDELWDRVVLTATELIVQAEDMAISKASFRQFSKHVSELKTIVRALQEKSIKATTGSELMVLALETLDSQLRKACNIIKKCNSGSPLLLLLNFRSTLQQIQQLGKEIAKTLSSFSLANFEVALSLKSEIQQIIDDFNSMEFKSEARTEAIMREIEKSTAENGNNRDRAVELLHKIAEAVGVIPDASLVQNELELLKQEKKELEERKMQAEALQLSQLIQLLYSTDMVPIQQEERITTNRDYQISSFMCPLCKRIMEDPVAIFCGHSFERTAIKERFQKRDMTCPTCKQELPSTELTPNITLRNTIEEWKKRNMEHKFQNAVLGAASEDPEMLNQALEDLHVLMETPHHRAVVSEKGLIPKIVESLQDQAVNSKAALKCLCYLANYSEENKVAIAEAGSIRRIVEMFYRGNVEPDAVTVLLELSEKEAIAEQIGNAKDCIPFLVSLLQNHNPNISEKTQKVLQNLSSNTHFVINMAEAGYFKHFLARFSEGPVETRAAMARALAKMQLSDESIGEFENKQYVSALVRMLSSSSPAYKSACLQCMKKLMAYQRMAGSFLADNDMVPALLRLVSFGNYELHSKQEATEILTSLVRASQLSDFETNEGLLQLQTPHTINLTLHLAAATSIPQTKAQLLRLLLGIGYRSERVRDLVRSNDNAMTLLFSSLNDQPEVRKQAMELIYCIVKDHPDGIPFPPSPAKEHAINTLVTILTSSLEIEERSTAAGIISLLPTDDATIDEILHKSEALKAIREVICSMEERDGNIHPSLADPSGSLLENALAALLRYTEPSKPDLQRQLGNLELYPSLIRVLSTGSSLAKQRTAIALARLSQSTSHSVTDTAVQADSYVPMLQLTRFLPSMSWCCSSMRARNWSLCSIHGSACSSRNAFCLVKVNAVRPLVRTLSETKSGASEAALLALDTLLADNSTISNAAVTIVESQGVGALLDVLEKGTLPAKDKALDLFQKIIEHYEMTKAESQRFKCILINLLNDNQLKKKAALGLSNMEVIPQQSSFF